ncbi:MAG TPA: hypothetical protein PLI98_14900 [Candidatus Hydrogenedentes bacterium]|jgi:hypothetical protein|nr:hypothetical protein [Candidatus Hydrogenedentota bacterium]
MRKAYKASTPHTCMMKHDIPKGIRELSAGLQRLEAHLAWLSLKEQEWEPGAPPALMMNPDLAAAIRNESSHFVATAMDIREALDEYGQDRIHQERCTRWRREVTRLEAAFYGLNLPKGL